MTRARACGARRARFRWFFGPVRRSRHPSPCGHLISILVRREPASTSRARASRAPGFALAPSCHRRAKTGLRVSRCVASRGRLAGAPLRASWRQNRTRFSSFLKRAHVVDRYFGAGVRAARAHLRSQPARGGVRFLASGRSSGHIRRFPRGTLVAALAAGQSSSNSRDHWHSTDSRHQRARLEITFAPATLTFSFTFPLVLSPPQAVGPLAATRASAPLVSPRSRSRRSARLSTSSTLTAPALSTPRSSRLRRRASASSPRRRRSRR